MKVAEAVQSVPDTRPDGLRGVAESMYGDPRSLPEATVKPMREMIAGGDCTGALDCRLPQVLAGVAALGRVRRRAEGLSPPEELTLARLRTDQDFESATDWGPSSPRFEK
ncbi:MAG: hypothetical protein AAF565_07545 [Pseudomonadota bacterium]